MLDIKDEGVILEKSKHKFENEAVLNPGCIEENEVIHMFYRAVEKGNYSTLGYCQLDKNNRLIERHDKPFMVPQFDYEKHGIEDPRIQKIGDTYYLFYTAYDGKNARIAYALSRDLKTFEKRGLVSPSMTYDEAEDIFRKSCGLQEKYFLFESFYKEKHGLDVLLWEKDAFLLPEKIKGKFVLFHRILPGIQIVHFKDFEELKSIAFWKEYLKNLGKNIVIDPKNWFEIRNVGGGCPPIETKKGWLLIYHAVEDTNHGKVYHAAVALLDKKNPLKVLSRLNYPLFSPNEPWERIGVVNNVVFPTSAILRSGRVTVFYGAADQLIAAKSFKLSDLLDELKKNKG
ncbi:MAG: pesticidal protein Cry7Aa [Candidatus Moranbacteria bacterium]|nr:pesticidal protein Cry7Aa [Candidatus Moranbacteria bacterium]